MSCKTISNGVQLNERVEAPIRPFCNRRRHAWARGMEFNLCVHVPHVCISEGFSPWVSILLLFLRFWPVVCLRMNACVWKWQLRCPSFRAYLLAYSFSRLRLAKKMHHWAPIHGVTHCKMWRSMKLNNEWLCTDQGSHRLVDHAIITHNVKLSSFPNPEMQRRHANA